MGRLRDIADSIKAAIDSLKDAIRSKGVEVEDSAKASELPALIASMNTGKESRVSFTLITHGDDKVVPACIVDSPAPLEGLFSFHHSGARAELLYPPVTLDSISIPPGSVKGESANRMFYVDGVNAEGTDWTTQALDGHGITIESYQAEVAVTADEIFASAYYISSAIYANFGPLGDWITRAYKAFYNRYAVSATVVGPNGLTESRFMFLGFGGDELLIRCSFLHVEPGNAKYTFAYWIEGFGFRRINISSSIECEDASGMFMNCTFESSDETLSSPVSSSNNVLHIVNLESEFFGVWTKEHFMERADHMFADCRVLQNVSLGSGFPNLESAEYMFRGCDILECVLFPKAPNLSLRHVFSLGGMTEIYVNDGAFTDATSAEGAFEECTRLETLNLPVGFCSNVTDASLMFSNCTSLTTIKRNDGGEVYAGGGDGILCLQVSCDLSDTALDHDSVVRVLRSLRDPLDGAATLELGALMGKLWTAQDADDLHLPTTRGWTITGTGTHALPEDGDLDAFYSGTMSEAGADDSLTIATCFNGIGMGTVDESSTILEEVNSFYEMAF